MFTRIICPQTHTHSHSELVEIWTTTIQSQVKYVKGDDETSTTPWWVEHWMHDPDNAQLNLAPKSNLIQLPQNVFIL